MKTYTNLTAYLLAGLSAAFKADAFTPDKIVGMLDSYADNMEIDNAAPNEVLLAAQAAWEQAGEVPPFGGAIDNAKVAFTEDAISVGLTGGPEDDADAFSDSDPGVDPDNEDEEANEEALLEAILEQAQDAN